MKKMLTMAAVCLMAAMAFAAQCAATTKKGTQCKRQASPDSEFCWQHGGATTAERGEGKGAPSARRRPRPEGADGEESPSQMRSRPRPENVDEDSAPRPSARRRSRPGRSADAEDAPVRAIEGRCQATTKNGAPCGRKASPGSNFCWQHGGAKAEKPDDGETAAPRRRPRRSDVEAPAPAPGPSAEGQCQATTKQGTPCRRKAQAGGRYCAQHAAKMGGGREGGAPVARPKRRAKPKATSADEMPSSPRADAGNSICQGKTKDGEPCRRKAKPGSNFCWQHAK